MLVAVAVEIGSRIPSNLLVARGDVEPLLIRATRNHGAGRGTAAFDYLQESVSRRWGRVLLCSYCGEILKFSPIKLAATNDSTRDDPAFFVAGAPFSFVFFDSGAKEFEDEGIVGNSHSDNP
ncbi:hypothetical protein AMTR_s00037p00114680 [Amborella trichopoda]|uniref:Uncharacterized protein n=1 Tax=Amborella trichopoda TaxID=13333 RepID=U5D521_AMBTC|nr:hypothetical protein AMTR_s00037p00114680 [Amborella trichopoda]